MITMEYAKLIIKFEKHLLPDFFNHYFTKIDSVQNYKSKRKQRCEVFL